MATSVVAVNPGLRKSARSSIGCEERRSARTNATPLTTATASATTTCTSPKEPAPPWMIP